MAPTGSLFERYRSGDRDGVWRALVALGPRVRDASHLADARAVATATMERVRQNLETIVDWLYARGYSFAYPDAVLRPPASDLTDKLDHLEAQGGTLPLVLRTFYDVVGEVCLTGSYGGLSGRAVTTDFASLIASTSAVLNEEPPPETEETVPPALRAHLDTLPPEQRQMVLRARAVARQVARGGEQPVGERRELARSLFEQMRARRVRTADVVVSDPLVVLAPHSAELVDYERLDAVDAHDPAPPATARYVLEIAPDALHKANLSGGDSYSVVFPDPAADAPIRGLEAPSLVEYLRSAFRWGGFPGLARARPGVSIAWLTDGLAEI